MRRRRRRRKSKSRVTQAVASGRAITNFIDAASRSLEVEKPPAQIAIHRPLAGRAGDSPDEGDGFEPGDDAGAIETDVHSSNRHHRVRKADFPAGADNGSVIPPDTQGTVGPNHLMAVLNSNVTIETRTGVVLSSIPIASFWSSLGGISEAFDPRVLFDAYANRWIISAGANAASPTAYILIGVSQTNDPTGAWNLYKVNVDANGASWADYPTLGFNGDWIVLQTNVFTVSQGAYVGSYIYAFDKADLYAGGAGQYTVFHDPTGFTDYPAVTHDNTLATEYLVRNWSGASGTLRVSTITGSIGAEVLTTGVAFPKRGERMAGFRSRELRPAAWLDLTDRHRRRPNRELRLSKRIAVGRADGVLPRDRHSDAIIGAVVANQYCERQRRRRAATWEARRSVGTVRLRVSDARRQRERRHDDRLLAVRCVTVCERQLLVSAAYRSARYARGRHRLQGGRGADTSKTSARATIDGATTAT